MNDVIRRVLEFLSKRSHAYHVLHSAAPAASKIVLADLARFCRANTTTFHPDPRVHAALEGRREVFLRITNHLNLTPAQLYEIYNAAGQPMEK